MGGYNRTKFEYGDMNVNDLDEKRKYSLLRIFFSLSLVINAFFVVLQLYLKNTELALVALINIFVFGGNFYLLQKRKYLLAMHIGITAITIASLASNFYLGWESYFSLYLIASTIIIINSVTLSLRRKLIEVTALMTLFVASFIHMKTFTPLYDLNPVLVERIGLFNSGAVLFSVLFMQFHNFIENENLKKKLQEMSEIDPLTGAYNRRFFNEYLDIELKRLESPSRYAPAKKTNFGIAIIDIDDFKMINDMYGHLVGDMVIAEVAGIIKSAIFKRDIFCRYGGEEFLVLFTNTSKSGVKIAIEKIRTAIQNHVFMTHGERLNIEVTVSVGFAGFSEEANVYKLLDLADKRLYKVKGAGKNGAILGE